MEISRKTVLGILFVVFLLLATGFQYTMRLQIERDSYQSAASGYRVQAEYWRNQDSSSQASIKDTYATIEVLKETHGKELSELQKRIDGLKKNLSNLDSHTKTVTSTVGSVRVTLSPVNPQLGSRSFAYRDRYMSMTGIFSRDSALVDYSVTDTISVTQYWKRDPGISGWFKPRSLYTDVISENPNSTIKSLSSTKVREKPGSRLGLGLFGGFAPGSGVVVGVGVTYDIIKF